MISSFSSSSIERTTGALHLEYPLTLRACLLKQFSSTEQTNWRSSGSYRSWRSRDSVVAIWMEDAFAWTMTFFEIVSQCFRDHKNKLLRNRDACGGYYRRCCFPKMVINGSFSKIDRKRSLWISISGTECIYIFLTVFANHLSTVVWLS